MNPKTTLSLIVVLALAGAILLVTSQGKQASNDNEVATDEAAGIIDPELLGPSLSRITFYDSSNIPLEFERIAGEWLVTSPHRFPANTTAIDKALDLLAALKGEPSDQNFGPYPRQRGITLGNEKKSISLLIDNELGAGKAGLALMKDNKTENFVVSTEIHDLHDQIFEQDGHHKFYAKEMTPLLMPEYGRVEITTIESSSILQQMGNRWVIGEDKLAERALESQIGEHPGIADYFKLFESLEIDQFIDCYFESDTAKYGLNRPIITARFIPLGADPKRMNTGMTLRVGAPADLADQTRYCSYGQSDSTHPIVFTTPTPIALAFGQDARRFRDPRMTSLPRHLIKTLRLEQPDRRGVILQLDSGRTENLLPATPETGDYPVDIKPQGQEILNRLFELRASEYLEAEESSTQRIATIQFDTTLNSGSEIITVYEDIDPGLRDANILIRRGNESVLLRFDRHVLDQLRRLPDRLNNK